MVVLTGPSPKRRRTDTGPVSDDQVRESNATLAIFMGQRHNRWMQNTTTHRDGRASNGDVTLRRSSGAQRTEGAGANSMKSHLASIAPAGPSDKSPVPSIVTNNATGAERERRRPSAGALPNSAGPSTVTANSGQTAEAAIDLVDYETPPAASAPSPNAPSSTVPSPNMANGALLAILNHKKNQDAQARMPGRQGLPSPAPSEDPHSPLAVNAPNPLHQQAADLDVAPMQRPKSRAASVQTASTAAGSPIMTTSMSPMLPSPPGPYSTPFGQRASTGHASSAVRGPPFNNAHGFGPSPLQHQHGTLPGTRNSPYNSRAAALPAQHQRRSSSTVLPRPVPGQPQQTQPPRQRPHGVNALAGSAVTGPPQLSLSNFYPRNEMLGTISQQMLIHENHPPSEQRERNIGRLHLLTEAVNKNDWFYIVLNQLSCVHSIDGSQLPQITLEMVPEVAYKALSRLLCPNQQLGAELVKFFSDFPAPLMRIYSGGHGQNQIYNMLTEQVAIFMQCLPRNFDTLENGCVEARTPPLVQDIVEQLSLPSQVLQTTIFRAIARRVWTDQPGSAEPGINMLLRLHYADQEQQRMNFRSRTPMEKQPMYHAMQRAYAAWSQYELRRIEIITRMPTTATATARPLAPFVIPGDVLQIFGLPLQTPMPLASSPVPNGPNNVPWTIQQQQQQQQQQAAIERQPRDLQQRPFHGSTNVRAGMIQPPHPDRPHPDRVLELQRQLAAQQARVTQRLRNPVHIQKLPPLARAVFPPDKECPRPQPTQPDTARHALHQAHLRSPILAPGSQRMYRHVHGFPVAPKQLRRGPPIQTFTFDSNDMSKVPPTIKASAGRYKRDPTEGSHEYRLRCAVFYPERGFPDFGSWVAADNVWPDCVYFEVNGTDLEIRRKLHHGRYLPIDLTELIKAGKNELRVIVNRTSKDTSPFSYAIAVELVRTIRHETLVNDIRLNRYISAQDSLHAITRTLKPTADDDDVVMTSSTMIIKLFDPISCASIFSTPVRSQYCKHRDPFDLDLYLQTRRRKQEDWPTDVDVWKCPICRQDASPQHLLIDGWLMQVREELAKRSLLDTRAIVVEADGSWRPKEEERTGVRSPSMEWEERAASADAKQSRGPRGTPVVVPPKKAPLVIELD